MHKDPLTTQEQMFDMGKAREVEERAKKLSEEIEDEDLAYGIWYNVRDEISKGNLGKAESIVKEYEEYGPSKQTTSYVKQIYNGALTEARQKFQFNPSDLDVRHEKDKERTYQWKDIVGKYVFKLIDPPWDVRHKQAVRRAVIMGAIQSVAPGDDYWPMVMSEAWSKVYYRHQ